MPDVSTNSYTLSEVANIIDVDEKTLHLYAHKGLLNPTLLSDSKARFSDVDCARLKMIKRANDIGYKPEDIFNLIGNSEDVLNVEDPVSACQQYATEKYKQIFDELSGCEPLEQLNKKCDLKLLKSYLNNLDGRQEEPAPKRPPKKAAPGRLQPRAADLAQTLTLTPEQQQMSTPAPKHRAQPPASSAPEQEESRSPRVLSYSVDKLWDYVKSADPEDEHFETAPQEETLPFGRDDLTFQDTDKETFSASPHFQRVIDSRWWSTGHEGYRKILSKPAWRNWIFSLLILALAITGIVRIFSHPKETPQTQIATDAPAADPAKETETPPPTVAEKEPSTDKETSTEPYTPKEPQPEKQREAQPESTVAEVDKSKETPLHDKSSLAEEKSSSLLQVRELSLWHDSLNDIYRVDFTIFKNIEVTDQEPVSGYAFIHLETQADENANPKGLLLPQGELESGTPTEIRRGANFSIRNLIKMRIKTISPIPPDSISAGKLLVYSTEGKLLLEQPFKVPIQPFFSTTAEKPPTPGDNETAQVVPSTPPSEPEPEPQAEPEPQPETTEKEEIALTPQPEKPETSPAVASSTTSVEEDPLSTDRSQAVAPPSQAPQNQDVEMKPMARILKTDNPDAAIWEQKSYDAAVSGNFDRAISDATKAIELDPGRVNPYINRSWAYIEKNMLEKAIMDCKIALSIDPENTFAYNNRGLAFQRRNQMTQAQNDYKKACELGLELGCQNLNGIANQSQITELIEQSKTAFRAKDWDGVIRATTAVIEIDPQNSVAYTNRSAAYAQKNYLVKALKDSNEAIRYDSQFSLAYNNRGYVFELLGNNRKAAADYLKSCSLGLNLGCKNFDKLN